MAPPSAHICKRKQGPLILKDSLLVAGSLFSGKGSLLSKGSPFRKGALLSPGSVLVRKIQLFSLDPTFGLRKHSLYPTFSTFSTSEEPWPHRQHTQIKQIGTRGSPQRGGVSGPGRLEVSF